MARRSYCTRVDQLPRNRVLRAVLIVLAFQTAWAACAYGAVHDLPQVGVLACFACIVVGLALAPYRQGLLALVLALGLYGLIAETIILGAGLISFNAHWPHSALAPLWIIGLWMAFATLIEPAFGWLQGRPLMASALGAAAGPISYSAAMRLGALHFNQPEWLGIAAIGLTWAVAMPFALRLSDRLQGRKP
mgnify:FL=1